MMRGESVLCATCGREFTIGLIELVRMARKPAECEACCGLRDEPPCLSDDSVDAEVA